MPKVSLIVPVYNTEKYLADCLDSIINQSLQDIEIICIDDASTDSSPGILKEYAEKDKRIVIVTCRENKGQANARNLGLDRVGGEYVYFIDSDDMLKADALDRLYSIASKERLEILSFDADVIYETTEIKNEFPCMMKRSFSCQDVITGIDFLREMQKHSDGSRAVWRAFWKTEFLRRHSLYFKAYASPHEDRLFTFLAMFHARHIRYVSETFYIYRRRSGSIMTGGMTEKRFRSMCVICTEVISFINGLPADALSDAADVLELCAQEELAGARMYWRELLRLGHNPAMINMPSLSTKLLAGAMFTSGYRLINRSFPGDIGERLSDKPIIIYGAGQLCIETMNWLRDMGLWWSYIAVSDAEEIDRSKMKNISLLANLVALRKECIVLIAAGPPYNTIMENKLKSMGFIDYISMVV